MDVRMSTSMRELFMNLAISVKATGNPGRNGNVTVTCSFPRDFMTRSTSSAFHASAFSLI